MRKEISNSVQGRCYCGSVQFELTFPTDMCGHCHCESCRRAHGAAFVTWTGAPKTQFRFLSGKDKIKKYKSSADVDWGFCSDCGTSFLYEHAQAPDRVWVTLGSLSGPIDRAPDSHVSFEEHVNWFKVNDSLPRYREKSNELMHDDPQTLRQSLSSSVKRSMAVGKLIIFSGLPGSGKSTLASNLASQLSATYLRIDTIEQALCEICDVTQMDGKGYEVAHRLADENLRMGNTVIADSVNPWELTRTAWNSVAQKIGLPFINIEVVCTDKVEHRMRIESRTSQVPGLKMPNWEDVVTRDYHEWSGERLRIDTSGKEIEKCMEELTQMLGIQDRGL